jgi:hypothetical protein
MERLISLFREADYEKWSPANPQPAPPAEQEPLYFRQLLEFLREQRARREEREQREAREKCEGEEVAEDEELIAAGA